MNIIMVIDSYDTESIHRMDYFSAVLQTLCKYKYLINDWLAEALAREQIRDGFLSKQC
jgi:hypothetical protein